MKLGLICSAGGASMALAYDLLLATGHSPDWVLVTDRDCGAESEARRRGISTKRIEFAGRDDFCTKAADWLFADQGCDWTALFFSRLVNERIYSTAPCVNIHPGLLPAFPGLAAVKAAQSARARVFGATAHLVDASVDQGPILAQAWSPMPRLLKIAERISYVQKSYVLLSVYEAAMTKGVARLGETIWGADSKQTPWANPALANPAVEEALRKFLAAEGISWTI